MNAFENYSLVEQELSYNYNIPPLPIHLLPDIPREEKGIPFDIFNYEFLFNDPETLRLIKNGLTIGCFYIESPGMRSLLKRLDVETFKMLTAASSIIRPGVAESGMMQEFIARHKDPSRRKYLLPQMEEVLGETYGVMIYQEDVIKVAHHIAGLTLEEADVLRRAMSGKMRSHQAMQLIINRFFESCKTKKISPAVSQELWRQIESFAGYSFCKAHSASFALLSYQVAFLKAHFPAEFMACVLNNGGGFYASAVYIQEAKRFGIKILLPCINESEYEYKGKDKEIRIGLMAVKHLSSSSIQIIVEQRIKYGKYVSLSDFIVRTKLGIKETQLLIKCGAMDCFGETRCTLLRLTDVYFNKFKMLQEGYNDLFMNESFELEKAVITKKDFSIEEKCIAEYEAFDYMVTKHPLEFFTEYNEKFHLTPSEQMNKYAGKRIRMIGWYMSSKRIRTKKGDIMKFLSLEDLTGTYEAVIFPRAYNKFAEKTLSMGPYIVEGRIDADNPNNIIVEDLKILSNEKVKLESYNDSAEKYYVPDDEGLRAEDIYYSTLPAGQAGSLDVEKLRTAYAG
jgi:DNA polymerase III alpha subunit